MQTSEALPDSSTESPAQRQARLRRERRNAKIQAGGSARLNAITSLSGRAAPSDSPSITPTVTASPRVSSTPTQPSPSTPDPEEVDISQHYYTPQSRRTPQPPFSQNASVQNYDPSMPDSFGFPDMAPAAGTSDDANNDPMFRMLQQMIGGGGQPGAQGSTEEDPMLRMMQRMMGGAAGSGQSQKEQPATNSAYIWRLTHAVSSLFIALYVILGTAFDGRRVSRTQVQDSEAGGFGQRLFLLFATVEVVLQSSRYFLEKGRLPGGGLLVTLSDILPEPYAGYVRVVGRYSVIYTTVVADAMVIVFILGCMAWWRGAVTS